MDLAYTIKTVQSIILLTFSSQRWLYYTINKIIFLLHGLLIDFGNKILKYEEAVGETAETTFRVEELIKEIPEIQKKREKN